MTRRRARLDRLTRTREPEHLASRRTLLRLLRDVNGPSDKARGTPAYEHVPRCDAADRLLPLAQAATDPRTVDEVWRQAVPEVLGWRPFGGRTWAATVAHAEGGDPHLIAYVASLGLDS